MTTYFQRRSSLTTSSTNTLKTSWWRASVRLLHDISFAVRMAPRHTGGYRILDHFSRGHQYSENQISSTRRWIAPLVLFPSRFPVHPSSRSVGHVVAPPGACFYYSVREQCLNNWTECFPTSILLGMWSHSSKTSRFRPTTWSSALHNLIGLHNPTSRVVRFPFSASEAHHCSRHI